MTPTYVFPYPHTLFGQSIDVRRMVYLAAVRRNCMGGVIVRHDEEDVWARTHERLQSVELVKLRVHGVRS